MNRNYLLLTSVLIFGISGSLFAQNIKISIFNDHSLKSFIFFPNHDEFLLKANQDIIDTLYLTDILYFSLINNEIAVRKRNHLLGSYKNLEIVNTQKSGSFKIRPVSPSLKTRFYNGNLTVKVDFNRLLVVNHANINEYLAGVVEAEGGPNAPEEFYKAQSLLCRTYTYQNIDRHIEEGFNLCDGVHCQAFKGKSMRNGMIIKSVLATKDDVIISTENKLITAAFHSNSGGMTEDAKNVWLEDAPYLKPVKDPFSLKGRNAQWEKVISRKKWEFYLKDHNFFINDNEKPGYYSSEQKTREQYYKVGLDILSYQRIRKEWLLKSAFFSVIDNDGENIMLKGKGYGHGVGMSQEGAMQMAKAGYSFIDIINFYFKNVKIVDYVKLEKNDKTADTDL